MGVPQGSVLGPILFLLYINDIPNVISNESVKTILFADDTCIYLSGKNANDLKELATNTMYELQEWFSLNRLTLNLDKTHFCIFHSPRKKIQPNYNDITIGNQKITRMNGIPYLGVNLDETLTWKNHTKYLTEQLIKTASSFKLIKNYIPHKCKRELYFAYIFSKVNYCIEGYGHTTTSNLKQLQIVQNRALKILYNKDWFTPTNELHKSLKLLQIKDIFKISILKFVHRNLNCKLPNIFDNFFSHRISIHQRNTRHAKRLNIIKTKSNAGKKTIKFKGAIFYNELPYDLINCNSLKTFNKKAKNLLLAKY